MYLYEMTGAKKHMNKYIGLQCSELFHSKLETGFLRQHLQSSFSLGKIQNKGDPELSEDKI